MYVEIKDSGLLECDNSVTGQMVPDAPSKCQEPFNQHCSVTSQKTGILHYTAQKTSENECWFTSDFRARE
jgi:hypothetical protein